MNILMTGTDGMLGSRLFHFLSNNHDVMKFQGDVTDTEHWNKHDEKIDLIIHLAALAGVRDSMLYPEKYYKANVIGTKNMFEFAQDAVIDKVLYASSSNAWEWWSNPYAATKKMNEVQAMSYSTPSIGMRFHTIWPGRQDMLFRKFENNEVTYINKNHYRDFIHVIDLMSAIDILVDHFEEITDPVVDIGTGTSVSVAEVAKLFNFDGTWIKTNPVGERIKTHADVDWLLSYGWNPRYNILNKEHHTDYVT